ncbi:MAG: DUF2330 domain-containing protein [Deltaproteobacteria bacterium]|nr:DUF2330 domain-containing protein [Deltaproteobacteria bacterium]
MRASLVAAALLASAGDAAAFCGFYIDTGGAEMFADATRVVLMRDGTRTVLAMQNSYGGPPHDFAVVVPVPTVPRRGDVRTLPRATFDRVDAMSAPRLVEYWEEDPCGPIAIDDESFNWSFGGQYWRDELGYYRVKVEAQYDVDEYQVTILSAAESAGLARYLRDQKYKIPDGAERMLRPYVEAGAKFFVAKVDPTKLKFERGRAMLSPLRVHYDSEDFALPIRLGLANSAGAQDLVVNILARDRYEVANRPNAFIPTNLDVVDGVRTRFGEFYGALFARTVELHPRAVITEYAWAAASCDPCPGAQLTPHDLDLLGQDVLSPAARGRLIADAPARARYTAAELPTTSCSAPRRRCAAATNGSRGAAPAGVNAFQARYAIRHRWTGPVTCAHPDRGRWGARSTPRTAIDPYIPGAPVAPLHELVADDVPELRVAAAPLMWPPVTVRVRHGCGCASSGSGGSGDSGGALAGLTLALLVGRRRRRRAARTTCRS